MGGVTPHHSPLVKFQVLLDNQILIRNVFFSLLLTHVYQGLVTTDIVLLALLS